jgi:hypothetical protein
MGDPESHGRAPGGFRYFLAKHYATLYTCPFPLKMDTAWPPFPTSRRNNFASQRWHLILLSRFTYQGMGRPEGNDLQQHKPARARDPSFWRSRGGPPPELLSLPAEPTGFGVPTSGNAAPTLIVPGSGMVALCAESSPGVQHRAEFSTPTPDLFPILHPHRCEEPLSGRESRACCGLRWNFNTRDSAQAWLGDSHRSTSDTTNLGLSCARDWGADLGSAWPWQSLGDESAAGCRGRGLRRARESRPRPAGQSPSSTRCSDVRCVPEILAAST